MLWLAIRKLREKIEAALVWRQADELSVLHPAQDPASDLFTALVMAAASAANGRNALARAPSLPRHPLPASHPPAPAHQHEKPEAEP
jgi:hypothetical protein